MSQLRSLPVLLLTPPRTKNLQNPALPLRTSENPSPKLNVASPPVCHFQTWWVSLVEPQWLVQLCHGCPAPGMGDSVKATLGCTWPVFRCAAPRAGKETPVAVPVLCGAQLCLSGVMIWVGFCDKETPCSEQWEPQRSLQESLERPLVPKLGILLEMSPKAGVTPCTPAPLLRSARP